MAKKRKLKLKLTHEVADHITVARLEEARDALLQSLRMREEGGESIGIFDTDRKKDLKQINKHLRAFDRVLEYLGE